MRQVTELYAELRAAERRHTDPVEALDASTALLHRLLGERAMTYDEFVWWLTSPEGTA